MLEKERVRRGLEAWRTQCEHNVVEAGDDNGRGSSSPIRGRGGMLGASGLDVVVVKLAVSGPEQNVGAAKMFQLGRWSELHRLLAPLLLRAEII